MTRSAIGLAALALSLLCLSACNSKKPVEKVFPSRDIEIVGTGYQVFGTGTEAKLYLYQNPEKGGEWTIRATVPIRKMGKTAKVAELVTTLDLLDANASRVNDAFTLEGQDIESLLPILNTDENAIRNVVYTTSSQVDYGAAKKILEQTQSLKLLFDLPKNAKAAPGGAAASEGAAFPANPTVENLVQYYGIRGLLSEYESAYRKNNQNKLKQLEDRLDKIEDQIKNHPRAGKKMARKVKDWVDDRIIAIEDRIDN